MNNLWKQATQIGTAVAVIAGLWMALQLGIGEALTVVTDPTAVAPETIASYGGQIDFVDRLATAGVFVTLLSGAGLGVLRASSDQYPFVNTVIRYTPVIIGLIGVTSFSGTVADIIQGDYVYSAFDDAQNAYHLFLTGSVVAALGSLLKK